jgi:hypothetical protein
MGFVPPVIVKFAVFEMLPLGAGLVTVTAAVPVEAMAVAGTGAVNSQELTNVVASVVPPKLTIEAPLKFVPMTSRVKAALPATELIGKIVVIAGPVGLDPPGGVVGALYPHP